MKFSQSQFLINKKNIKRRKKKKKETEVRCYHCGGAFKGSEEMKSCLMCGREETHTCNNCLYDQKDRDTKKSA